LGENNVPLLKSNLAVLLSAALCAAPAFASHTHRVTGAHASIRLHASASRHAAAAKAVHRLHGQQAIDSDRVTQIQQALVREHYLSSDPNGQWDSTTESAMQKFQADQGWQTKLMPDSRALKKLGLGPDYSGAINAKSSNFAPPPPASTIPTEQAAGFLQGSGVAQ
jgi:peptidoglycan hydrolase-like protein with peptidoglycan-binding domain